MAKHNVLFTFISKNAFEYYMSCYGTYELEFSSSIVICDFCFDNTKTSSEDLSFLEFINTVLAYSKEQPFPLYTILRGYEFVTIKEGIVENTNIDKKLLHKLNTDLSFVLDSIPSYNGLFIKNINYQNQKYIMDFVKYEDKTRGSFTIYEDGLAIDKNQIVFELMTGNEKSIHKSQGSNMFVQYDMLLNCPKDFVTCEYKSPKQIKDLENEFHEAFKEKIKPSKKTSNTYLYPYFIKNDEMEYFRVLDTTIDNFLNYYGKIADTVPNLVIGLSGGLDSAFTLLLLSLAFDQTMLDKKLIHTLIMPSRETSTESVELAKKLACAIGVTWKVIDISSIVDETNKALDNTDKNVMYENSQARIRSSIILNYCNQINGSMIGTTDFSELCLGFITFGGDSVSHFQMIKGLPKVVVKTLTQYIADNEPDYKETLYKIINRPISPELISGQKTEDMIGLYEINDLIIYLLLNNKTKTQITTILEKQFNLDKSQAYSYYENFKERFLKNQFKLNYVANGTNPLSISFDTIRKVLQK